MTGLRALSLEVWGITCQQRQPGHSAWGMALSGGTAHPARDATFVPDGKSAILLDFLGDRPGLLIEMRSAEVVRDPDGGRKTIQILELSRNARESRDFAVSMQTDIAGKDGAAREHEVMGWRIRRPGGVLRRKYGYVNP